jgi:MOSC domain-containing protein YiiM
MSEGRVIAVCRSASHTMSKPVCRRIRLIVGHGVEGDAHAGTTVKHRSRVARDPTQPNLRQVHLIHAELFDELRLTGFEVTAGLMGENITTRGIDLLALPRGGRLRIGADAIVEITGLRNPCTQLDGLQAGLMAAVLERDPVHGLIRKAGVMGIVVASGDVAPGDVIRAMPTPGANEALKPV